jgi:hypothetical protein
MRLADERQNAYNWARFVNPDQSDELLITPEEDRELRDSQRIWVRTYASECGVLPDRPTPNPIPRYVIDCFKRAGQARIKWLREFRKIAVNRYNAEVADSRSNSNPTHSQNGELGSAEKKSLNAWMACLGDAASALAGQPDAAITVAEAAYGSCGAEEMEFKKVGEMSANDMKKLKEEVMTPKILARIMTLRAAASKLEREEEAKGKSTFRRM